jgi:LCP family protein required for cell wall assembly
VKKTGESDYNAGSRNQDLMNLTTNYYPGNPPGIGPNNIDHFQPVRVSREQQRSWQRRRRKTGPGCGSCLLALLALSFFLITVVAAYFLAPVRTRFLVLGIDRVPDGTALGRSDTMMLVSVDPLWPTLKLLSIPRDLWVTIPGVGENRINTAHFFAEANQAGSGPLAAVRTVDENFDLPVRYYLRVRFDAFQRIVDALGGVTLNLAQDTGGLPAGSHHLDGAQALAFARDRKGADDFFRMEHGQLLVRAVATEALSPRAWSRMPAVAQAVFASVDTNLPIWQWPRLGLAFLRAGLSDRFESYTIRREMTTPHITEGGANVLLPNWALINPYVQEIFQ